MTRDEFLTQKYMEKVVRYHENHAAFFANPSTERVDPFKIADGLYYVGDKCVCVHLIDTGDGLILIDSGYLGATHILVDSIWRAGFDPKNVRWILHSHGHSDHFGASEEFRIMYGTKLAMSKVDVQRLKINPEKHVNKKNYPFAKVPEFDYELEDGEIFELGNVKIRCVLTPGHTDGVMSFFFDVTDNGKTYLAGTYGGAGVNAITLPYIHNLGRNPKCAQQMLDSMDLLLKEPVEVHLGNHPYNSNTMEKREKQLKEGGNPFVDAQSWPNFLNGLKVKVEKIIKDNEEMEKQIAELCSND